MLGTPLARKTLKLWKKSLEALLQRQPQRLQHR